MGKRHVAVAMGGYSSEFEISLNSGKVVCESLNQDHYHVYPIHILKDNWYFLNKNGDQIPIDKSNFSFIPARQLCINKLMHQSIPKNKQAITVVEIASGFSFNLTLP